MKNIIFTFCFLILTSTLFAQIKKVDEVNASMSQGTNRGFKVLIPETSEKETIKAWSKLMKDYDAKTDKVKKEKDYLSPDASIPALGERPINVYAQFQETPEGTYLTTFFDLGGAYLNRDMHKEQTEAAQKMLKTFATNLAKSTIEAKVKEETKKLEKLEKEKKNLVKDKEGYEKNIKEAKESIQKNEKAIVENTEAQKNKAKEIAEQTEVSDKIKAKLKKF